MFGFWKNMDEDRKARLIFGTGLAVGVFTLFTFLSTVSYLFTWKQDMSLLNDPEMMDKATEVANWGGKLGLRFAHFLVADLFGLGSIALVLILGLVSHRLITRTRTFSTLKTFFVVITGTVISSFALAYFSDLAGGTLYNDLGNGLGGGCGSAFVEWATNVMGSLVTLGVISVLAILWLFCVSDSFSGWALGGRKAKEEAAPVEEEVIEEEPVKPEPVVEIAPAPAPVPEPEPEYSPVTAPVQETSPAPVSEQTADGGFEVINDGNLSTEVQEELPRIDVRAELPKYVFPSLDLLDDYASSRNEISSEELTRNNNKIRATLANYKIQIDDVKAVVGPTVTLYKVYPSKGVKISAIKNLQDDIAMYLHAKGVRVVNLPDSVGIEVANDVPSTVPLKATLNDDAFRYTNAELPVAIGYTIQQKVKVFDLADAPHLLVAGATKQGKSVGLNVIVASLLYAKHPSELKLVFIDPKMVEFSSYANLLKHYLAVLPSACNEQDEMDHAIVKKPKDAEQILRSLCIEMDERYELLSKAFVNNIKLYNEKYKDRHLLPTDGHRFLPYLVVVIDEYADLTMSVGSGGEARNIARSITQSIIRLAQKGRAAGIHVILATQRPSVDVITGLIKTNFPTRIAFRVVSRVDSQTILDSPGADKLIGKGDMLFYAGVEMERVQCAFISNDEINKLTQSIGSQVGYQKSYNTPYYLPEPDPAPGEEGEGGMIDMKNLDDRFAEAARMVVTTQKGSTSDIQRRLGMGYAKAGRVMDQLEAAGIVGPQEGSKPRQVLIGSLDELESVLKAFTSAAE